MPCAPAMAKWSPFAMSPSARRGPGAGAGGRNGTGKTTPTSSIVGITRRFGGSRALADWTSPRCAQDQRARAGDPLGATGAQHLPLADGRGKHDRGGPAGPVTVDRVYEMFPRLKERAQQFRQPALGAASSRCWRLARALTLDPRVCCSTSRPRGLVPIIVEELLRALGTITWVRRHLFDHRRAECAKDLGLAGSGCDIGTRRNRA